MRLLVVSHTPHYRRDERLVGWGPTVREIDRLATLFDEVVHVAPVYPGTAPPSELAYEAENVRVHPVRPGGGERLVDKLSILTQAPAWTRAIASEMRHADVMHVRCPANIGLVALGLMAASPWPRRRWIKYAGNWAGRADEPVSYRMQREWAERRLLHRGVVTVNGDWPAQPAHVHSFLNPCLTDEEVDDGRAVAAAKRLAAPVRLLFVGRLDRDKGVDDILAAAARLVQAGVPFELDLVGDGPRIEEYRRTAAALAAPVRIHGWMPRAAIGRLYAEAHLFLLPSASEGWPKVISEAMAYGVVPIASHVSSIPGILAAFATGTTIAPGDPEALARAIRSYVDDGERWQRESRHAAASAPRFSYANYLQRVKQLLHLPASP
jgi:glycosyltransferase involved in cell wall biosynthesis